MTKLLGILLFAVMFMDPCNRKPTKIDFKDVETACSSDVSRMYVRIKGKVRSKGFVECSDMPGGRYCQVLIGSAAGDQELAVLIPGKVKRDTMPQLFSVLVAPKDTVTDDFKPYSVPVDRMEIYDRDGNLVDHTNGVLDVAGSLVLDEATKACSLKVAKVENEQSR